MNNSCMMIATVVSIRFHPVLKLTLNLVEFSLCEKNIFYYFPDLELCKLLDYWMYFHAVCVVYKKTLFWISFWIQQLDIVPSHCSQALGTPLPKKTQIF